MYGATSDEWGVFARALGLTRYLLPVVQNPHAEVAPGSTLPAGNVGKVPSRYDRNNRVAGIRGWTEHETTPDEIARWRRNADYGICIRTGDVLALDVDIDDAAVAERIRAAVCQAADAALPARRRAGVGRMVLAFYDLCGRDVQKRVIRTAAGAIELLGRGQQFVAAGTHRSGARYEWEGGLPSELPAVDVEAVWRAVQSVAAEIGLEGAHDTTRPARRRGAAVAASDPVADTLDLIWTVRGEHSGALDVQCPWEHEHSDGAGAPSSTVWFRAGTNGYDTGAFRCLHAHCSHRTTRDFLVAVGLEAEPVDLLPDEGDAPALPGDPPYQAPAGGRDQYGVLRDAKRRAEPSVSNVLAMLAYKETVGLRYRYDQFLSTDLVLDGGTWRETSDTDVTDLRVRLETTFNFRPVGVDTARQALRRAAAGDRHDSLTEWATSLKWDKTPRIDRLMADYFGAEDTDYARAVGAYIMTALAGRALCPGAKADMAPVLIGKQGIGKSTAVRLLACGDERYRQLNLSRDPDDIARILAGATVVELPELSGLRQAEIEHVKSVLSSVQDEWTPKYVEKPTVRKRRVLFIGTTNENRILHDRTGERRWLPIVVGEIKMIDRARLAADVLQLWAEGVHRFVENGVEWIDAEELARKQHPEHVAFDPWLEVLSSWLIGRDYDDSGRMIAEREALRPMEVLTQAVRIDPAKVTDRLVNRLDAVMAALGFDVTQIRIGGTATPVYACPPERREELIARLCAASGRRPASRPVADNLIDLANRRTK